MPRQKKSRTNEQSRSAASQIISPVAQRFPDAFVHEPMAMDDVHSAAHASLTKSPEPEIHKRRRLPIQDDSTIEDAYRTSHRGPPDSFTTTTTRPPPSSTTGATPPPDSLRKDTLLTMDEDKAPARGPSAMSMPIPRTPPRSSHLSLHATISVAKSPSRTQSLPTVSPERPALADAAEEAGGSLHRVSSAMAKRSAGPSSGRKPQPVSLSSPKKPSPIKTRKNTIEENDADDEGPSQASTNPISATQSMPELGESPQHRISPITLLPKVLRHQKPTPPQPINHESSTRGGDDTQSSASSREFRTLSRYMRDDENKVSRPLTQFIVGENPPGIFIQSQTQTQTQTQSQVDPSHEAGESLSHVPRTLVRGTPSETSETSQHERDWRAIEHEELVPTQILESTQELLPTQDATEFVETALVDTQDGAPMYEASPSKPIKTLNISPVKKRGGYFSSSSAQSIPGLYLPGDGKSSESQQSQLSEKSINQPAAPLAMPRVFAVTASGATTGTPSLQKEGPASTLRRNPIKSSRPGGYRTTSGSQNDNLPQNPKSSVNHPVSSAANGHVPKRNPLARRKTPVDLSQLLQGLEQRERVVVPSSDPFMPIEADQSTLPEETMPVSFPVGEQEAIDEPQIEQEDEILAERDSSEPAKSEIMETDDEPQAMHALDTPRPLPKHQEHTVAVQDPAQYRSDTDTEERPPRSISTTKTPVSKQSSKTISSSPSKGSSKVTAKQGSPIKRPHGESVVERELSDQTSSPGDDESDYVPQTQTQKDDLEGEVVESYPGEDAWDESQSPRRPGKRSANEQGGRKGKRICRRTASPKVGVDDVEGEETPKGKQEQAPPKPAKPRLDLSAMMPPPGRRATRATANTRTRGISLNTPIVHSGHLVMAHFPESKRFFPGYAVARTGVKWQVNPCDDSPSVFVEPGSMRRCVFREGDIVTMTPDGNGENYGDAIVILVDSKWDEELVVKLRIGADDDVEERYVHVRHISVQDQHITKQWDTRKVSHRDLETEEPVAESPVPMSAIGRTGSLIITPPLKATAPSSFRGQPGISGKMFAGVGFIISSFDRDTKFLTDNGGIIFPSWLDAFRFDGVIEKVKGGPTRAKRWTRGMSTGRGRNKMSPSAPVTWIGGDFDVTVRTMFVIAGKCAMTPKYLMALALGIPIVSPKWLDECKETSSRVNWLPYLLPAHPQNSPLSIVSSLPYQTPDPLWGSPMYDASILQNLLAHGPLHHRRILADKPSVLFVAADCITKIEADLDAIKKDAYERPKDPSCEFPFVYCCLAMGAQQIEAVEKYDHATDPTLLKYNVVVLADELHGPKAKENILLASLPKTLVEAAKSGVQVLNQTDFKMSLACGKLLTVSHRPNHHVSATI